MSTADNPRLGFRYFLLIWSGQLISTFGTALTGFVLGIWVYQDTGSVSKFSFVLLSSSLPGVISSPFIGSLIDRHDRRKMLMASNLGALLCIATLAILFMGQPSIWSIYILVAMASVFRTAQWPTFSALTAYLVPRERLGNANGLVEFGRSASLVTAPMLGGVLLETVGVGPVMMLDVASYCFALLVLALLPFTNVVQSSKSRRRTLAGEAWEGFLYIKRKSGLLVLLLLFATLNLITGVLQVILTPFVLGLASTETLGLVAGISSGGMVIGGLIMAAWGGPKSKIRGILVIMSFQGLGLIFVGLAPLVVVVTVAMVLFMVCIPLVNGCSQTIWQTAVEAEYHGRIFSIRRTIATMTFPVAYVIGGPLADFFAGIPAWNLPWAAAAPEASQGLGLLFSLLGFLVVLNALSGFRYRPLTQLDKEVT